MLNLEWVTRKLLPAVIERRSIVTKKKPLASPPTPPPAAQSENETSLSSNNASPISKCETSSPSPDHHHQQTTTTTTNENSSQSPPINPHNNGNKNAEKEKEEINKTLSQAGDESKNNKNPFLGPKAQSVVPPQVFVAILDEAIAVLKKGAPSSAENNNIFKSVKFPPSLDDDYEPVISSACYEAFPEITLEEGFKRKKKTKNQKQQETQATFTDDEDKDDSINNAKNTSSSSSTRKIHVIGPLRGHSVPLARMLLQVLTRAKEEKRALPNFVFLGDIIDSGPCSMETTAIVLALFVAYHREREAIFKFICKKKQQEQQQQQQQTTNNTNAVTNATAAAVEGSPLQSSLMGSPVHEPNNYSSSGSPSTANAFLQTPMLQSSTLQTNNNNVASSLQRPSNLRLADSTSATPKATPIDVQATADQKPPNQQQLTSTASSATSSPLSASSSAAPFFSTNEDVSFSDGPLCIPLRGRHESHFPAPSKWTGTPQAQYRRLDDEISDMFGPNLDITSHSLIHALSKLKQVFAWLPVACVIRCRVKQPINKQMIDNYYGKGPTPQSQSAANSFEMLDTNNNNNNNNMQQPSMSSQTGLSQEDYDNHDYFFEQNRIQQTSFLCMPGGPSPCLLRFSSFADMKEMVVGAVNRSLRADMVVSNTVGKQQPLQNTTNASSTVPSSNKNEISPVHMPSQAVVVADDENTKLELSPPAAAVAVKSSPKFGRAKKNNNNNNAFALEQQKRQDEQLVKDLASSEPYEDDEDRAATAGGILFSDNPDTSRNPGMCCFSTEAAATLLARSGAQSIIRGSSFTLQRIPVSAPNKIQKNVKEFQQQKEEENLLGSISRSSLSSRRSSSVSSVSSSSSLVNKREASQQQNQNQIQEYTFRPKASPYDPGFRMYRLPSYVKRAVQKGSVPSFGVCASPLSLSQATSIQDLNALVVTSGSTSAENLDDLTTQSSTTAGNSPTKLMEEPSMMKGARFGSQNSNASSIANQMINSNFAKGVLGNNNNISANAAGVHTMQQLQQHLLRQHQRQYNDSNDNNNKNKNSGSSRPSSTFPFLPQVVSLFSAPHFGNNLKSRNLGCVAIIQCAEAKKSNNDDNRRENIDDHDNGTNQQQQQSQRGAFVSLVQFDDPEPLMFAPLSSSEDEEENAEVVLQDEEENEDNNSNNNADILALNENEIALLRRLKRVCQTLKDNGQLHLLKRDRS